MIYIQQHHLPIVWWVVSVILRIHVKWIVLWSITTTVVILTMGISTTQGITLHFTQVPLPFWKDPVTDAYDHGDKRAQSTPGPGSGNSPWGGSPPEGELSSFESVIHTDQLLGSAQRMRRSDTQYSDPTSSHDQTLMHGPVYDEPVPDYTPNLSYTMLPSMTPVDAKAYLERGHPSMQVHNHRDITSHCHR